MSRSGPAAPLVGLGASGGPRRRRNQLIGAGGLLGAFLVAAVLLVVAFVTFLDGCANLFSFDTGPGDGKYSVHLAVSVTPTTGLGTGSRVRVRVTSDTAFESHRIVGVTVCLREADTKRRGVLTSAELRHTRALE